MMCKAYVFNYSDTFIDSEGHIRRFNKNEYKVVIGL